MIVDGRGRPLPSEFLPDEKTFQPHYQVIDAENQVQIYEELTLNGKKEFSTSFIHRDSHPKDNRLLARGWLSGNHLATKSPIVKQFLVATDPEGISVLQDPDFGDNGGQGASGIDHIRYVISLPSGVHKEDVAVTATMYYQSIPPYFLAQRFKIAPKGEATRRLYYLTSRLTTKETPIENWKLRLVSATTDTTQKPPAPEAAASGGRVADRSPSAARRRTRTAAELRHINQSNCSAYGREIPRRSASGGVGHEGVRAFPTGKMAPRSLSWLRHTRRHRTLHRLVMWQEQALGLTVDEHEKENLRRRLELYKNQKPYREPAG